jgi:thiamine kinase-like enzyme
VALLAKKMAKMHSLDVPIAKDSHQFLMKNYWDLFAAPVFESYKKGHIYDEIQRHKLQTFMEMDLCDEMSWAMEVSVGLGGPVVFTHNDLMRRNILVRNTCHTNADDLDVFIVDYDWSCYMFRGADFADYFIDWCQPELDFGGNEFPTDQQMYAFIDAYISGMSALSGDSYTKRVVNSRETLVMEAKVFALVSLCKIIFWSLSIGINENPEYLVNSF